MKLQNILMPQPNLCTEKEMYFRLDKKVHLVEAHQALLFEKYGVASFDTYFNSFSIEKWKKYTQADDIFITLFLQGAFEIRLMQKSKAHNSLSEKELSIQTFESEDLKSITFPFISYEENGMYFIRLEALREGSRFCGGFFSCELSEDKLLPVNLAINICTFRREKFVERNLTLLQKNILNCSENELSQHLHVFISDNGKSLDIEKLSSEKIHIVPNKNVGGSGGFTRGLLEILHSPYKATHALFMDDDIVIEPEALYRTYSFLRCLKQEYRDIFVGGAMLRLDQPTIQVEAGAAWFEGNLDSRKSGLDLKDAEACLYNEVEEYYEFHAWWYCCIPMTVVSKNNLPLPIFIRGDDVEYGLRNMKHLVLLNGICVWHEPFENKYSSFLEYYILRNMLYDNALHCPNYSKRKFLKKFYGSVLRQLVYYRYKNIDLIFRGVNDFLKGVNFLKNTDGEQLHKEIMSAGYKAQPMEELNMPFSYPNYDNSFHENEKKAHRFIRFLSFNGLLFPANRETIVSMAQCRPINFYRAKRVLQYDVTSKKGFVTEKQLGKSTIYIFQMIPITLKILWHFNGVIRDFHAHGNELITEEFWKKYLEL